MSECLLSYLYLRSYFCVSLFLLFVFPLLYFVHRNLLWYSFHLSSMFTILFCFSLPSSIFFCSCTFLFFISTHTVHNRTNKGTSLSEEDAENRERWKLSVSNPSRKNINKKKYILFYSYSSLLSSFWKRKEIWDHLAVCLSMCLCPACRC
jgi:hypothetical protein